MATADYDYTQEQVATADDFEIAPAVAPAKTADEIEAESGYEEIPPGTHELVVVGFLGAPKAERKEVYVDRQRRPLDTHSVKVKFALPDEPGKQVTDFFLLPPSDPDQMEAYLKGSKGPEGKAPGFNANKFFHFVERLGFIPVVGSDGVKHLPAEACRLGNWKGRRVGATVVAGDPFTKRVVNTETGEEEEQTRAGRNQVKLFSYREAGATKAGYQRAAVQATTQPRTAGARTVQPTKPAVPATPPAPSLEQQLAILNQSLEAAIADEDFAEAKAIKDQMARLKAQAGRGPVQPARQPAMAGGDRGLGNL